LGSASASTNRLFTLAGTGARLSSTVTNSNAIVWSNTGAIVHGIVGPQLITFEGTSVGDNTFNPRLTDAGTGANVTSVTKTGAGQWNLGNTNNTYTGITTVSNGILALNAPASLSATSPLQLSPTSATSAAAHPRCPPASASPRGVSPRLLTADRLRLPADSRARGGREGWRRAEAVIFFVVCASAARCQT
jgi:autotransporter-associated beta strand protein